jgi:sugar lactone lactonase YvrE
VTALRKALIAAAVLLLAAIAYLLLAPVPVQPVAWNAPEDPGYSGPHSQNNRLASLQHLAIGGETGPESIALGPDGKLYASVASGAIVRLNPDGTGFEKWADTGGRVLGIEFDADGRLIAADAEQGLLSVGPDGRHEVLCDNVAGDPNLLEHSATGRLLKYDRATRRARIVLSDLCFANGVALSADESRLFVVETGEYRVWSVDPGADDVGAKSAVGGTPQARVLLSNLPGYPDNLTRGSNGRIWLGLVKPRSALVDRLAGRPFVRKAIVRLPRPLWPVPPAYGHVLAFDETGAVLADLQDPAGAHPETTGAIETEDRLFIQSLHAKSIAWLSKADAGLR